MMQLMGSHRSGRLHEYTYTHVVEIRLAVCIILPRRACFHLLLQRQDASHTGRQEVAMLTMLLVRGSMRLVAGMRHGPLSLDVESCGRLPRRHL
jgi:hypothetical protein